MLAYTLRRIAQLVPVLLVLSVAVFGFVEALPGSIVDTMIGTEGGDDAETRHILAKEYGLDSRTQLQLTGGQLADRKGHHHQRNHQILPA